MLRILILLLCTACLPLEAQTITLSLDREQDAGLAHLPRALQWRTARPGLTWSEAPLRAGALRWPVRAIVVRLDPDSFDLELVHSTRANRMTGTWTVDSAAADAALALNAGQFKETGPWGWVVLNAYEHRDPGYGPLSVGIAIDTAGRVRWVPPSGLAQARKDNSIRFAFQSYPLLLLDGKVPPLLHTSDDVDRDHRDARLILAQMPDGALIVVLTRYDGFGEATGRVPIGLTVLESVELMKALRVRHAVMLDGGISAQMLVRQNDGITHKWNGFRSVPLALIARSRKR